VRFAFSFPLVRATVGATSRRQNLDAFLQAASGETIAPLPPAIAADLVRLQYRWSDETDVHAKPWTM
jgi:hypothetical protein